MGDGALSQEEIDKLLRGISNNEEIEITNNKAEIKDYDFRSPKKFTKERVKQLHSIFEAYSRMVSSYFTSSLRLYTKVSVSSVEEQKFYEFNNALPDYVIMGLSRLQINDEDLDDLNVTIQLSNSLTFLIIDRLLGGNGKSKEVDRDFTELEITVMDSVLSELTRMLREPWLSYAEFKPVFNTIETNARVSSSALYNETMIIAVLEVDINGNNAMISVCIPAVQLDVFMHKYAKVAAQARRTLSPSREKERTNAILSAVQQSKLPISAILGDVTLDVFDVINLQVNDIIPLQRSINSNIIVRVGEGKWYDGKLGVFNNRKAVRIENIYKDIKKT